MAFRTIEARFAGTCRRCGGPIEPGERIRWAKGAGSYHLVADCGTSPDDHRDDRAGPWKSGYGEYPYADEVYDLTHPAEPEEAYD
jgi:hypothetical protein